MKEAGLVQINGIGRERFCHANAQPLQEVDKWPKFYEKSWDGAIGNLGSYLDHKS